VSAQAQGSTLVVGLVLLALISALALSGAGAARVELSLARNEQFRENAASAASAGIESAISRIVSSSIIDHSPIELRASLPEIDSSFEASTRWLGLLTGLPQAPGANLVGAQFEIVATGRSGRGGYDRQRAIIMKVVSSPSSIDAMDCEPLAPGVPCVAIGQWRRLSWQRLAHE
jgi:hypothetical protein